MTDGSSDMPTPPGLPWHLPPASRIWIGGHNVAARCVLERSLRAAVRSPDGPIDAGFIVPKTTDEGVYFLEKLRHRILPAGTIWVVYPGPWSPPGVEFEGRREDLIDGAAALGFISGPIAEVDIDDHYTAQGFHLAAG